MNEEIVRKTTQGLFALCLLIGSVSCAETQKGTSVTEDSEEKGKVLATLNGDEIRQSEFDEFVRITQGELQEDPSPAPVRELFREFITRRLLLQGAQKLGITVRSDEIQKMTEEWTTEEADISPDLDDYIYEFLVTQKFLRQTVLIDSEITLREMQNHYQASLEGFTVDDQAHVLEILVEDRKTAESIRNELQEGDARRFREMARQFSVGLTAESGGDLGFFQKGDLPEEFEKVIFGLKPGQISSPFQSGYGFHLFLLEEWIPRHAQKFYEVRKQIFDELTENKERAALESFLRDLFLNADIEFMEPSLEFDIEENLTDETEAQ